MVTDPRTIELLQARARPARGERRFGPLRIVGVPSLSDPRIPFALLLTLYVIGGVLLTGFARSPQQLAFTVLVTCALDMLLHALLRERAVLVPLSAYISALSLGLLLNYGHGYAPVLVPVLLTVVSKYLLTFRGRHVFNPSMFGVSVTLLFAGGLVTTASAYQWGGTWGVSAFMVMGALVLFVFRVGRGWLVGSFLVFYALQLALRAYLMRHHIPVEMLVLGTISTPPFFLFVFFMLTDPATSPATRRGQVATAGAIVVVDLFLHTRHSVFTFYYAALTVATARFCWMHLAEIRRGGTAALRARLLTPDLARTVGAVAALALGTAAALQVPLAPAASRPDPGMRMVEVPASQSGLEIELDPDSLELPDRRLQHISKWLMSVGSAGAATDLDMDGRLDVVMTNPLAVPGDRVVAFRNLGGFRFQRLELHGIEHLTGDVRGAGIPSGLLFFDNDDDGDDDLLLLMSFGQSRLLRNDGAVANASGVRFRDVSNVAGIDAHTITVAANVLDADRDGAVDVLLANVLPTHLESYDPPVPLSIFDLPEARFEGDRRMFRFMHDGWHDADNGGQNIFWSGRGDGTFEQREIEELGMPERHWSLDIATLDADSDGDTDLYLASDFGPDDFYLNRGGRFDRVSSRWFGDLGKDTYKGMNATATDLTGDGRPEIYVSNVHHRLQAEGSLLWVHRGTDEQGMPRYRDEAAGRGVLNPQRFAWGASAADLNNDGWPDLVQANGMVGDTLDDRYAGCPDYWYVNHKLMQSGPEVHTYADQWGDLRGRCIYPQERWRVYLNRGGAGPQFVDVAEEVGLTGRGNGRAVVHADFDNDGVVDTLLVNQDSGPRLFRGRLSGGAGDNQFIGISLRGAADGCTSQAWGSHVEVERPAGDLGPRLVRERRARNGLSSQGDGRLHFGLGDWAEATARVTVEWCGSGVTETHELAVDDYWIITQGDAPRRAS